MIMAAVCYAEDVAALALQQVGKSCGKTNEYSAELDKVAFYNGKKNGIADSCSIFVDDMVWRCSKPQTANEVRAVLYEPNVDNCGAGCSWAASYFKSHNAWISKPENAKVGDKVIFAADQYKSSINPYGYYHTGVVVSIDYTAKTFKTVEGNTNGGKVASKSYSFTESKVTKGGFGRPKYATKPTPEPAPTPEPTPEPTPTPSGNKYKVVNIRTFLAIRSTPEVKSDDSNKVGELYNNTIVTVIETSNGWAKITGDCWVSLKYLKKL